MPPSRYKTLQAISTPDETAHAGLWLDKFLKGTGDDAKKNLVKEVAEKLKPSELYERFYKRCEKTLTEMGAECRSAKVLGRLAINLGTEAVLETSIALHHTYGVPYIPGSALKGLAAHYAAKNLMNEKEWGKDKPAFITLFGDTKTAGYVTFFDALFVPGSGVHHQALWPDVITVHHPTYYQSGSEPPADWDNPTPIPFLTATGEFLIALDGPAEWVNAAFEILKLALEHEGIGAKTSSGYGRMVFISRGEDKSVDQSQSRAPQEVPAGYQRGVVKKFVEPYGFIQPDGGGPDVFVHVSGLTAGLSTLQPKQRVVYKPGPGRKPGQIQANDVKLEQ